MNDLVEPTPPQPTLALTLQSRSLLEIAVRQSASRATMTFNELVAGCTPDEREQLAWHIAICPHGARPSPLQSMMFSITRFDG
jgi:hypothetical protein